MKNLRPILVVMVVSAVSALCSLLFSISVDTCDKIYNRYAWLAFLLPLAGLTAYGIYRLCKIDYEISTTEVILRIDDKRPIPTKLAPSIFLGTCLSIICGGSVGKEAAALQMGAAIGEKLSNALHDERCRDIIILSGMASAFSVLLGTPIAAAIFVLEITERKRTSIRLFLLVLLSALIAKAIAHFLNADELAQTIAFCDLSYTTAIKFLLMIVCVSVLSIVLCLVLKYGRIAVAKTKLPRPAVICVSGVLLGCILFFGDLSIASGTGLNEIKSALSGVDNSLFFAVKFIATCCFLCLGFKGGEIMPTLCIGATFGCFYAGIVDLDPVFMTAMGMIAMLSACANCPIAAVFLGVELFGWSNLAWIIVAGIAPFLCTCFISFYKNVGFFYMVAHRLRGVIE